ncbi:pentatricopeptide repeat-containing protein At5g13770, chloroplastic isoform X2 [Cornus florida]|uniref:pentatricopeptide repeat-containing protein At5g13770, chloroplastic isoform X2 n=1 Tax=Cornus florida TaxID=4283 RepID=UPI00289740AB|nr:pentatricopeptide repeat-containing protein At5g13770, chloroplastic isoform X2 [Cornus florida]
MAITSSSDQWSSAAAAWINNCRREQQSYYCYKPSWSTTSIFTTTTTTTSSSSSNSACKSRFLSSKSRLLLVTAAKSSSSSSSCPSPKILEINPPPPPASFSSSSTNHPSLIELSDPKDEYGHHFRTIPEKEYSDDNLNALICTLSKDPQTQQLAYQYYQQAKQKLPNFTPHKSTFNHLIRYLITSKDWSSILSLSQDFNHFNLFPDSSTCCRLVSSCIRARKFKLVNTLLRVFESRRHAQDQNIAVLAAFDSAMRGYNKLHMYSSTVVVYESMRSAGILMDPACYCRIMEAYMKIGNSDRVLHLFQEFQTSCRTTTTVRGSTTTTTIPFYTQLSYRILCQSLGKSGRAFEALEFFREMTDKGITAAEDHLIYSSLICSFTSIRQVQVAEQLFKEAESKKMLRDPAVFLKLVLMYIEQGMMEKTLEVVAAMKRVKIRVSDCIFCAIVNGFSKRRGLKAAAQVYEELILQGCQPGQVSYASIINIYCQLGLNFRAETVFSEMMQKGFDKCVVAYSSMVAMYGKTSRLRDAMRLVAKMKQKGCEPNVWIYNSLLDMHGRVLNLRQVDKIWKEMKRRKVVPDKDMKSEGTSLDGRLYSSALNALRDAGLQMEEKWLHESFEAT